MTTSASNSMAAKFNSAFPALASKNFRYFWVGQCISLLGTWMQRTAQQWLVYSLTKSALLLGFLGVAQFGPMLLFSLLAGVVVDRYPKKKTLIFTQTALMLQALILAALVLTGIVRYWHVLVLATFLGLTNTLDMPARQAFIIDLVGKNALTNGIALNSAIVNLARIAGPALSAMLMAQYGAGYCFLLNGLSFIPVIGGLSLIKVRESTIEQAKDKLITSIIGGLKYIQAKPIIASSIFALVIVGTFAMNLDVIIPVFSDRVLGRGAHGYGLLLSASGVGAFTSAMFAATSVRNNPSRKLLYISGIMLAIFLAIAYFVHDFGIALAVITLVGFFNMLFMTLVNSTIQLNVNNEYRGRVMSVYTLAFAGTTPIGNLFAGSVIEKFGPSIGFLMCGLTTGILIVGLIVWVRRKDSIVLGD